jgi:hypothetical protein
MRNWILSSITWPISCLISSGLGACGGAQRQADAEQQQFECRDRVVSYVATHHLAGEVGVQMDCVEAGPRLKRWRVDKQGTREEDTRGMTPGEFDKVWREIDGSGWAFLKDCENGTLGKHDPVFVFDVKDDEQKGTFQCQSTSMPYPYNTIVDPLDAAAHKGRKQLGDPEPDDLKQFEKKDMQK